VEPPLPLVEPPLPLALLALAAPPLPLALVDAALLLALTDPPLPLVPVVVPAPEPHAAAAKTRPPTTKPARALVCIALFYGNPPREGTT
jgi:hypothetical protein